jgi:hypothetical protein
MASVRHGSCSAPSLRGCWAADAYRAFAEGFDVPVDDILKREGNAVLMWDATPTDEQASSVEDCLKS